MKFDLMVTGKDEFVYTAEADTIRHLCVREKKNVAQIYYYLFRNGPGHGSTLFCFIK